jgi:hypothetical protein
MDMKPASRFLFILAFASCMLLPWVEGHALTKTGAAHFQTYGCSVKLLDETRSDKEIQRTGSGMCGYWHSSPDVKLHREEFPVVITAIQVKGTGKGRETITAPKGCGKYGGCKKNDTATFHYSCDSDPWEKVAAGKPYHCNYVKCAADKTQCNRLYAAIKYSTNWKSIPLSTWAGKKKLWFPSASELYLARPKDGEQFDEEAAAKILVVGHVSDALMTEMTNKQMEIRVGKSDLAAGDASVSIMTPAKKALQLPQFPSEKNLPTTHTAMVSTLDNLAKHTKPGAIGSSWTAQICFVEGHPYDQTVCSSPIKFHIGKTIKSKSLSGAGGKSPQPTLPGGDGSQKGTDSALAPPPPLQAPATLPPLAPPAAARAPGAPAAPAPVAPAVLPAAPPSAIDTPASVPAAPVQPSGSTAPPPSLLAPEAPATAPRPAPGQRARDARQSR